MSLKDYVDFNCAMHDCQYCSVNGFHEEVD